MMTFPFFSNNCYSLTFPSSQTLCLRSSLLVCVDMCDGAKQHASEQLRQTLTSVRGGNEMARDVQQDLQLQVPWCPLFCLFIFWASVAVKAALRSGKFKMLQLRSNGGRMTELFWRSVGVGVLLGKLTLTWSSHLSKYHIWLHQKRKTFATSKLERSNWLCVREYQAQTNSYIYKYCLGLNVNIWFQQFLLFNIAPL